jgi:hypothetical protein
MLMNYASKNADALVVSIRWTMLTYPIPGLSAAAYDNGEGGIEYFEPREYFTFNSEKFDSGADGKRMAIENFMKSMLQLNKPTVLVYPVPELGWHISKYNLAYYSRHHKLPEIISTSYDRFKARNKFIHATLDRIPDSSNLSRVKPEEILCNTFVKDRCVAQVGGEPLYYDENHLSNKGARLVVDQVMQKISNGR